MVQSYDEDTESINGNVLEMNKIDLRMLLAADVHLGAKNLDIRMAEYIFARKDDGIHLINLKSFWDKLIFAARVIVSVENSKNICAVSSLPTGQKAVTKFAAVTKSTAFTGRFTPGTFTNHTTRTFREPQLIIACDPITDHQVIKEASYVGVPVIAFCDADTPLNYVDICIPANNKSKSSIALCFWFLAREVLRMRGDISRYYQWDVIPDTFIYRDPEEQDIANKKNAENAEDQSKALKAEPGADDRTALPLNDQVSTDINSSTNQKLQDVAS